MNTTRNSLDLSSKGLNQHPTWLVRIIPVEIGMFRATIFPVISDMTGKMTIRQRFYRRSIEKSLFLRTDSSFPLLGGIFDWNLD